MDVKSILSAAKFIRSIVLISALSACSDQLLVDDNLSSGDGGESSQGSRPGGDGTLSLFSEARAIRNLDLNNIFALVTVNGAQTRFDQSTDITLPPIELSQGNSLSLQIEWFETLDGEPLLLGVHDSTRDISADTDIVIGDGDYVTKGQTGDRFDVDGDSFSNLEERIADSNPRDVNSTPNADPPIDDFNVEITFQPFFGADSGSLNLDNIFANVNVNGDTARFDQGSAIVLPTVEISPGGSLAIQIAWFENIDGVPLPMASFDSSQVISADTNVVIGTDDYVTKGQNGDRFDPDNDGFSNLEERIAGSDPRDQTNTPGATNPPQELPADVEINLISSANAPVIDGLYEDAWNSARFSDVIGNQLDIDNLMVDQGAIRPDGQTDGMPKMRWFAMHDLQFLYLFIQAENVSTSNPIRDSDETTLWDDDSVGIFIDGNNSQGQSYDGVDDRHIVIPLLTSAADPTSNNTSFLAGPNSAPLPEFFFSSCRCTQDQHTWEIAIPMVAFGITDADTDFGIDIQINIDHDGGERDAKWGWAHPSRVDVDVDNTWQNPSLMGAARVSSN